MVGMAALSAENYANGKDVKNKFEVYTFSEHGHWLISVLTCALWYDSKALKDLSDCISTARHFALYEYVPEMQVPPKIANVIFQIERSKNISVFLSCFNLLLFLQSNTLINDNRNCYS